MQTSQEAMKKKVNHRGRDRGRDKGRAHADKILIVTVT